MDDKKEIEQLVKKMQQLNAYQNYKQNDIGSSQLLADVSKDRHRFYQTASDWALYNPDGGIWQMDIGGLAMENFTQKFSRALQIYASDFDDESYSKYASSWVRNTARPRIIRDCRSIYKFSGEQCDTDPLIFNCRNVALRLHDDKIEVLKHSPDLMLMQCADVIYNPDAECERFVKFVNDIFEGNQENIRYLQKFKGYCLSGLTELEKMWFYYGSTTRNGKTTLTETFLKLMGTYGLGMRPETLAVKFNNDSRTASPDLASLHGKRFALLPEPQRAMRLDCALVKRITGGNSITARFLHQNDITFKLNCKLVCDCNYLPVSSDSTIFQSERTEVLPFNRHFQPEEQDKTLKSKLTRPEELSGILNWCLAGWLMYKQEGLKRTDSIQAASTEYEANSDKMSNFINDCFIKATGCCVSVKQAYQVYENWCNDCGYGVENKSNFIADLKAKKLFKPTGTISGKTVRNVIVGYDILLDSDMVDDSDNPFLR